MSEYIVTTDRKSEATHPIQLKKGEWVECVEESDESGHWAGWVYCTGADKEGWVPKQIIEKSEAKGYIIEDYDATEFDLKVGEIIVADKRLNGWVYGAKSDKPDLLAWAPLNHLKEV